MGDGADLTRGWQRIWSGSGTAHSCTSRFLTNTGQSSWTRGFECHFRSPRKHYARQVSANLESRQRGPIVTRSERIRCDSRVLMPALISKALTQYGHTNDVRDAFA